MNEKAQFKLNQLQVNDIFIEKDETGKEIARKVTERIEHREVIIIRSTEIEGG